MLEDTANFSKNPSATSQTLRAFKSDKHSFYSGNETWKKYISNHYNNLICVSITLTNIYLTYKREIIVHIKSMAMAVTHVVQSDRGSSQCGERSCLWGTRWGSGGSGLQWGGVLVGTSLQTETCWHTHACKQPR